MGGNSNYGSGAMNKWQMAPSTAMNTPLVNQNTDPSLRLSGQALAMTQARNPAGVAQWAQYQQPQQQYGQPMQQYGQPQQYMGANAPLAPGNYNSGLRLSPGYLQQMQARNPAGQAWWDGLLAQTLASQKPRTGGGDPNGGPEQYVMDPRISGG
jgi:hypothetical protein